MTTIRTGNTERLEGGCQLRWSVCCIRSRIIGRQTTLNHRVPGSPGVSDPTPNRAFLRGFLATQCPGSCLCERSDLGPALQLFWTESERLKLLAPICRRITEPLDTDAAGQAALHGCFDKIGCEEGERDRHIDLPNAAFLTGA
jgi:hypothetical protein